MTDVEARAFVAQSLTEGFHLAKPDLTDARRTFEACRSMVDVVIDNYLKLRYLAAEQPIQGGKRVS